MLKSDRVVNMFKKLLMLVVLNVFLVSTSIASDPNERKAYIVYMGDVHPAGLSVATNHHHNLLLDVIGDEEVAKQSRIHSYGRSFNGFAARLLPHEVTRLSGKGSVISVFLNTVQQLHTTRSWNFLGVPLIKQQNSIDSDIIMAVLDTGIYMDSPSFKDHGYGPPPAKWKGKCVKAANFSGCNNKVIGANYYNLDAGNQKDLQETPSPTDNEGHGTHTSSTAAGNPVIGASLFGIASGIARGGVSSARIAMYKVCWNGGCSDMDLLAGIDDAIADGVDMISISIGGQTRPYFEDPMAIGSFHALRKGILTSSSAGNSGPYEGSVQNVAPWIMTVAASSIDRQFRTSIVLGNGFKSSGVCINTYSPKKEMYSLTSGAKAVNLTRGNSYGNASACDWGTLSMSKVQDKIVYCLGNGDQDFTIKGLKGQGTIMAISEEPDIAYTLLIPGTYVSLKDGDKIEQYINSTNYYAEKTQTNRDAKAIIYKSRTVPIKAPFVASFSSRGPQMLSPNILKPDIAAPGLDILAGYTKLASVTGSTDDGRFSLFNVLSGTSMACPHAAAAAAYVKTFWPTWSPAAIKSALMTTATPMKIKQADAELGSGSGQINPVKATNPGLVYDIAISSYIRFLCKEGYNSTTISLLTGGKYLCSDFKKAQGTDGLNYPSMHIQLAKPDSKIAATFYRMVTNVGSQHSVYKASVIAPKGLSVQVVPNTLTFNELNQKKSFKVILKGGALTNGNRILSASLKWSDSTHDVNSPILVYKKIVY